MAKKIIGNTKIELTNVRTGKVETYEKHNMLTDALTKIFTLNPNGDIHPSSLMPVIGRVLGGIALFPSTLQASANNDILFDDFTAYAQCNANGTEDTKRGSWNFTESGPIVGANGADGYKMVWDFTTSQGNGTYNAIGLVNPYIDKNRVNFPPTVCFGQTDGYSNWYVSQTTQPELFNVMADMNAYDAETGMMYRLQYNSATSIRLYKARRHMDKVLLGEAPIYGTTSPHVGNPPAVVPGVSALQYDYDYRDITLSTSIPPGIHSVHFRKESGTPYLYIFSIKSGSSGANNFIMTKINCDDYSATQSTLTYSGATFFAGTNDPRFYSELFPFFGNYLYVPQKDSGSSTAWNAYYKANITDTSDITSIAMPDEIKNDTNLRSCFYSLSPSSAGGYSSVKNGHSFWTKVLKHSDSTYTKTLMMIDDVMIPTNIRPLNQYPISAPTSVINLNDTWIMELYNDRGSLQIGYSLFNYYLASINNLASPITKTSEQLMKITYTLTEVIE